MRSALWVCAWLWLFACKPADEVATATLALHTLPSCALPAAASSAQSRLRASGDFASRTLAYDGPIDVPKGTAWLSVELVGKSTTDAALGGGLVAVRFAQLSRDVLLLPLDVRRSCPLGDPLAAASIDAALAPLPGGGLLIAGGRDDNGEASSRALVLPPGAALVSEVAGGMLFRRAGASATAVGTRVVIAGGGPDDSGPANDTFEIYDMTEARFESVDTRSNKLALGTRRDHGAVRLGDGRVLIVGGRAGAGPSAAALASAELIDPVAIGAHAVTGELAAARIAPQLVALDSGTVLVALGRDADGNALAAPPLERFDESHDRFEVVASLPSHLSAAVAALPGERLAYVGCDGDARGCQLSVLSFDAGGTPVELRTGVDLAGVGPLEQLRLLGLHDGRLLLTGDDPTTTPVSREGFLIDLAQALVSPRCNEDADAGQACVELSRVPAQLLELEDGTVAELDAAGASLRRIDVASELDDPPASLIDAASTAFVLDEAPRWLHEPGARLTALADGARLDLPHLRFADLRIELTLHGDGELLLEPELAPPIAFALHAGRAALDGCELPAKIGTTFSIERHGANFQSGNVRCAAKQLEGRVGFGLRLAKGASVSGVKLTRL